MYTIEQFSKLTGLSTKTLIKYENSGILKPEKIDEDKGDWYYGKESLKKIIDISILKSIEFSTKGIENLSKKMIDKKIKAMRGIRFIESNMSLLKSVKDKAVDGDNLSIFKLGDRCLNGEWNYRYSTTNFDDIVCFDYDYDFLQKKEDKSMPKILYFGSDDIETDTKPNKIIFENCIGTDTKQIFDYSDSGFTIIDEKGNKRRFSYFTLSHSFDLILCEMPSDDLSKRVKFHIYQSFRSINKIDYSANDIRKIYEKNKPQDDNYSVGIELNSSIIDDWKIYDKIKESQIDSYKGIRKGKRVEYLGPLFECLDIKENKDVFTIEEGESLLLVLRKGKEKILNRDNTKMSILMSKNNANEFAIRDTTKKEPRLLLGKYMTIKDEDYLFVKLGALKGLDDDVFVFIKKSSQIKDDDYEANDNEKDDFDFNF